MTDENQVEPAPAEVTESAPVAVETSVTPKEDTIPKSRFDEVYRHRREAERERDYWKEQAMRQAPKEPEPLKLPTPEEHGFDDAKYQTALIEYNKQIARHEAIEVIKAERANEQQQQKAQSFRQRETDFMATNPEYRDTVYSDAFMSIPLSAEVAGLIAESPDGPAIALSLAKNIEQAAYIASLPPVLAAKEIGKIEAKLLQAKEAPKPKPVLTNVPPPPPSIEATEPAVEKDPLKMSDTEFAKWRRRQIAQRR